MTKVEIKVNGKSVAREVEDRTLLVQLLREELGLTGTHVGCDTTQCGCCVVHMDGRPVKWCSVLAAMADGTEVLTIEGIGSPEKLHPMQEAFREFHALQCGFCTPGMIMTAIDIVRRHRQPDDETVRRELDGNLCRCTGYENIVRAIQACAARMPEA